MWVVCVRLKVKRGSGLAVGLVDDTAWYPHTAKFLQFGGRFDSEGVALARIHILLLSLATLRCGLCLWPDGESGGLGRSRVGDEQAVWRVGQSCVCCCQWQSLVWTRATDGFCVVRRLSVCEPRVVDGRYMGSDLRLVFRTCRATLVKAVLPNASRSPALSQSLICLLAVHAIAQSFQHLDCETRRPSSEVAGTVILGHWRRTKSFLVHTNNGTSNGCCRKLLHGRFTTAGRDASLLHSIGPVPPLGCL